MQYNVGDTVKISKEHIEHLNRLCGVYIVCPYVEVTRPNVNPWTLTVGARSEWYDLHNDGRLHECVLAVPVDQITLIEG